MKRIIRHGLTLIAGTLMTIALTFSTTQLLTAHEQCPNDGVNTMGTCVSYEHCWDKCYFVHGNNFTDADCSGGCCFCIL
jgi:hypothetical protein